MKKNLPPLGKRSPLARAIAALGGQAALGDRIGVKQQTVGYWMLKCGGRPPAEYVVDIERATNGLITRQELRPDLYAPLDLAATA